MTFLVLSLTLNGYSTSHGVVTRVKLWQYYLEALPGRFGTHPIGPASANQEALFVILFQHSSLSASVDS